ncbi:MULTISPECIES: hypothetical protein [Calothrix]|uniref:Uncharacterized protein n=2 Tax=Calothrix TaxID=1186 RepID=A0ABR8A643_9CYAN|nr:MULTISPECIES: hypothetical protein [Calothrix]MBD2194753.1 hypothetical protein [Calothrix parietina FACHB-288]MBD2225097.1 hypothetical protein [Calothrix anomala FACHB-343]
MDIASIVKFLAPCLPFLLNVGGKVADGAAQAVGEDVWNKAKAIWEKLQPKVEKKVAAKEAAADLAQNPDDEDLQASLRVQIKKILDADTVLADEIAKIWQPATDKPSGNITMNTNTYDHSKVNQVGNIEKADSITFK